jgi:hypothetical protein
LGEEVRDVPPESLAACGHLNESKDRMRDHTDHHHSTRRQWLKAALRGVALSGLAGIAAVLGLRRGGPAAHADGCPGQLPCGQCGWNVRCGLPPATAWRQTHRKPQAEGS